MYIDQVLLDILIEQLEISYEGTHAPWCSKKGNKGLWGRAAYWRVTLKSQPNNIGCWYKITTPVKSLSPKPETLKRLFRAELQRRIEAIHERCTTDHYGRIQIEYIDPCSIKRLVETALCDKYTDIHFKNTETMQSIYSGDYWNKLKAVSGE